MPLQTDLISRYTQLRHCGRQLNNQLMEMLSKGDIDAGANKLGMLHQGMLVLDSDDVMAVLMDYCIHDIRRRGRNAVERYLAKSPPPPDSDEMLILQAMRTARFGMFLIEERVPGTGANVCDVLRGQHFQLVDIALSQLARPGLLLPARIFEVDGITMTTGAPLPAKEIPESEQPVVMKMFQEAFAAFDRSDLSPDEASDVTALLICMALEGVVEEQSEFVDPDRLPEEPAHLRLTAPPRIGRNDACLCGSGKKFKRCCGARN